MTVTEQTVRQVFGPGPIAALTEMTIVIPFYNTSDIIVEEELNGVTTTMELGVDYTLVGGSGSGGTLTNLAETTADSNWVVYRAMPVQQVVDLENQDTMLPSAVEEGLDRLALMLLDAIDGSNRSVKADPGEINPTGLTMPDLATRASKILQWASDGEISAIDPGSVLPSEVTVSTFMKDTFLVLSSALAARGALAIGYGLNAGKAGSPAVGDIYFTTDSLEVYFCVSAGVWSLMSAAQETTVKPNLVINGSAKINQRVACNLTSTFKNDDFAFCLDHVMLVSDGASNVATVIQNTADRPNGASHCFELVTATGSKKYGLLFPIDNVRAAPLLSDDQSKVCSIRFKHKATSGVRNLQAGVLAWNGTADAITDPFSGTAWGIEGTRPTAQSGWTWENGATGAGAAFSTDTTWATKEITNIPIDTVGATNIAIAIWVDDLDLSVSTDKFYIAEVHLNEGDALAPYQPPSFEQEMAACTRFFRKSFPYTTQPAQNQGVAGALSGDVHERAVKTSTGVYERFAIPMHKTPSLVFYNPSAANAEWHEIVHDTTEGAVTTVYNCDSGFFVTHAVNTSSAQEEDSFALHYTALAEITA